MRGCDDDAVSLASLAQAVVDDDGSRDRRGRGPLVVMLGNDLDVVGTQYLDGSGPRGHGQGVGVLADEQRTVDALGGTVLDDCLGRGGDVGVIEGAVQGGAAVTRGAEDNHLVRVGGIGSDVVVGRQDGIDIDEIGFLGRFPSTFMSHGAILSPSGALRQVTVRNQGVQTIDRHRCWGGLREVWLNGRHVF